MRSNIMLAFVARTTLAQISTSQQLLSEEITITTRFRTGGKRHFQTTLFKYSVNKIVPKEGRKDVCEKSWL
jgi:hypothetical protein